MPTLDFGRVAAAAVSATFCHYDFFFTFSFPRDLLSFGCTNVAGISTQVDKNTHLDGAFVLFQFSSQAADGGGSSLDREAEEMLSTKQAKFQNAIDSFALFCFVFCRTNVSQPGKKVAG